MCTFSIVICCYNSGNRLKEVYKSITDACISLPFEIIVVDNSSTDNTAQIAQSFPPIRNLTRGKVIFEEKPGLGYARHSGLREATGTFICFLDDDNWIPPGYLEEVKTIFEDNAQVGIVGSGSRLPANMAAPRWFPIFARSFAVGDQYGRSGILEPGGFVWGA